MGIGRVVVQGSRAQRVVREGWSEIEGDLPPRRKGLTVASTDRVKGTVFVPFTREERSAESAAGEGEVARSEGHWLCGCRSQSSRSTTPVEAGRPEQRREEARRETPA